jgi:hypothetical protein
MVGAIFVVIGFVRYHRTGQIRLWAVGLGAALLLAAIVAPSLLDWPKRGWLILGFLMGRVVNPIVLSIMFFCVITPSAMVFRLFGYDPLHLKPDPHLKSYWQERSEPSSDMRMQF